MTTKSTLPRWMLDMASNPTTEHCNNEPETPVLKFNGEINYCTNIGDCGAACEQMMLGMDKVEELALGFDLEWPVNYKTGSGRTALIQLCPDDHTCHLFHVSRWNKLPTIFLHLIRHPKVQLVGLNIRNDLYKLGRDFDVSIETVLKENTIDLGDLTNEQLCCKQSWSLDRLALHLLKKQLPKTKSVRLSKWDDFNLSQDQLSYAATDAYASLLVYQHLQQIKSQTLKTTKQLDR